MASPPSKTGAEMDRRAVDSFLAAHDTGVLSLGVDNRGYGFPISYSYEADDDRLILGFVCSSDSKKRQFAGATEEATFTVYDYDDVDSWTSVVATGSIRELDGEDSLDVPDLFFRPDDATDGSMVDLDEFERAWYALDIDEVSGRRSGE